MKSIVNTQVKATITGIEPYGAFVSLADGTKGLLHISEISNDYVAKISDFVKVNDIIDVKVIDQLKDGNVRVSLKATLKESVRKRRRKHSLDLRQFSKGFSSLQKQYPSWIKQLEEEYER